jgi:hypothetical protein
MEQKSHIAGIFCDLTKAFDCVSHELLLCRLQYYGVRGVRFELIKSYLSDRKQRVDFKSISLSTQSSQWKSIKCEVPQGSVLGPLFSNTYVNDFPVFLKKFSEVIMFADDTNLLISAHNPDDLTHGMNCVLSLVSHWFLSNQLIMNASKSFVLKSTPSKFTYCPLNLIHNDQVLSEQDVIKFLGLHLDRHLPWETHLNHLLSKLGPVCFIMRKLSHASLRIVYFVHFQSLILCGLIFLGNAGQYEKGIFASKKNNKDYAGARA